MLKKSKIHDSVKVANVMLHETSVSAENGIPDSTVRLHSRIDVFRGDEKIGPRTKCRFCFKQDSKYTCPRCNLPYCSVNCFKSSNHAGCSESFYKDCMMLEMQTLSFTTSEKLKVMKMIQDHERSYVDKEEDEDESLQRRLEGVNLDDENHLWTVLTAEEKADFQKSLDTGILIEEWRPWWYNHDASLITEIGEPADNQIKDSTPFTAPRAKLDVPKFMLLTGGKTPSPLVANNLIEVLYVYAYYTRKYNGSTKDFMAEVGCNLILSSAFLVDGLTRSSLPEAIQFVMEKCLLLNRDTSEPTEAIEILMDVYHILVGPQRDDIAQYVKTSIADSHAHCKALKQCPGKHPVIKRATLKKVLKKLEFLYAWADHYTLQLPIIATEVLKIFKSKMNWHKIHEKHKNEVEQSKPRALATSQLIKEVT